MKECQEHELPEFEFQQWTHFCVTFEKLLEPSGGVGGNVTTRIITYMDGYATAQCITDVEMEPSKYRRLPGGGVLVLGQDQDSPGARFDPGQSVSAKLTQFGMWKEVLTPAEIRYDFTERFTIC